MKNRNGTLFVTGEKFKKLNAKAIKYKLNRSVNKKFAKKIPNHWKLPVVFVMDHGNWQMRCKFSCANPINPAEHLNDGLWLDMSRKDFGKLEKFIHHEVMA
jgi:hypothetical protein